MSYSLHTSTDRNQVQRDVEEALGRAVWLTRHKKYIPALETFEDQLHRLALPSDDPARLRYMSFYGLCIAMVHGHVDDAERHCRRAIQGCAPGADLYFNLGMVLLRDRRRREALLQFREGLAIDPDYSELRATLDRLRPRRGLTFPFLERRHPLNRFTGLLRSRLARLAGASDDPVPDFSGEA